MGIRLPCDFRAPGLICAPHTELGVGDAREPHGAELGTQRIGRGTDQNVFNVHVLAIV